MNQLLKSETVVLIVGAGPTGLTMACELLRRGIPCRLLDKSDAPSQTSKALGIQSRTQEVGSYAVLSDLVKNKQSLNHFPVVQTNLYF